jgi:L-lactate dehydrogenase complex protein LldG
MSAVAPGPESRRARDAILGRLRAATITDPRPAPDVAGFYAARAAQLAPDPATRVERFSAQMRSWRGEVIETRSADWADALAGVVAAKKLRHLLAGRDTWLTTDLAARFSPQQLDWFDDSLERFKLRLFERHDAGITTTRGAIAETGTLMIWPSISEPRTLSLVPPLHIAVLQASRIVETFHDAVAGGSWAENLPGNALLVTGPSKTSDIQRVLAFGAHGPKELVVILIRDDLEAAS